MSRFDTHCMKQDTFTLEEGDVVIQWPASLSQESFEDFKDWLRLLERRVARSVQAPKTAEQSTDDD